MNIVIYARFSCHSQTEQSIEGQLKVCYEYAEQNHYTVIGEYIDRAQSGKYDNRSEFQRMISDSEKHTFEGVLVYQLDRFARNRYDSAIYKSKLKKNGVRVLSAKENITDDASGILVEGILESMAEYYSAELSQKINRGLAINAAKCLSTGSNPGLGYKVDSERRFHVDEEEAKIVREIYERYASGESKSEIVRDLQRRKVKTSLGNDFSFTSLTNLLRNKRYIGIYKYKDIETPGGMPRILEDDLFYKVQEILEKNKRAPARTRGEGEYLLTTKLFCGHCKNMMIGYCGTGKYGAKYHYYICKEVRKKRCDKKIISKKLIEDRVIEECLKLLTDENIHFIAKKVADECNKRKGSSARAERLHSAGDFRDELVVAAENRVHVAQSGAHDDAARPIVACARLIEAANISRAAAGIHDDDEPAEWEEDRGRSRVIRSEGRQEETQTFHETPPSFSRSASVRRSSAS